MVVLTIPLALMGAVFGLWIAGQTINLMTLGGLSLAVGILVDEATVVIENIHTQMGKGGPRGEGRAVGEGIPGLTPHLQTLAPRPSPLATPSIARAVLIGTTETTVPNMLAMLCILAVFVPSFLMEGAARGLFVPLAISVGFAMVTAFILSITFVPVLSIWLLRHHTEPVDHRGRFFLAVRPIHWLVHQLKSNLPSSDRFTFARFQARYTLLLSWMLSWRWVLLPTYVVLAALVLGLVGSQVGREIAPQVDSGQFQMRIRAPSGTRLELNEEITREGARQSSRTRSDRKTSRCRWPTSASRRRLTPSTPSICGQAASIRRSCESRCARTAACASPN